MTVSKAIKEKRKLKGTVKQLVLCKSELFYFVDGKWLEDTVYPVDMETAQSEAEFFGVAVSEE